MAGDWIKMRTDLADDPSVLFISSATSTDEYSVVGRLHKIWAWADRHTTDGFIPKASAAWVDKLVSFDGFAKAACDAGWMVLCEDGIRLPNFERHNGETAKKRCLTAKRVARFEKKKAERPLTQAGEKTNASSVSKLTLETLGERYLEKRREEELRPSPTPSVTEGDLCNSVIPKDEPTDPNFDERIQPLWDGIQQISKQVDPSKDVPKLTPYRRTYCAKALDLHSVDELLLAWRWMASSGSERAVNVRAKWKGVDTFLRPENVTGYVEMAKAEQAGARASPSSSWEISEEQLAREADDRRRDAAIRARTPEQIENEKRLIREAQERLRKQAAERRTAAL